MSARYSAPSASILVCFSVRIAAGPDRTEKGTLLELGESRGGQLHTGNLGDIRAGLEVNRSVLEGLDLRGAAAAADGLSIRGRSPEGAINASGGQPYADRSRP